MVNKNMNQKGHISIILISLLVLSAIALSAPTLAEGPKAVYGALYIDEGQGYKIAEDGIEVKLEIDGETFSSFTSLNETSQINYGIGIEPGYESQTGYFYVGDDDVVPDDITYAVSYTHLTLPTN